MRQTNRHPLRTALSLLLVGFYVIGLVAMMTFSFRVGIIFWVISTLGGIGLLYWIRTVDERDASANAPDSSEESLNDNPEETGKA